MGRLAIITAGPSSRGSATKDFEELFACLTGRHVKALVVGSLGLTVGDFTSPGKIVQLGVAPNRIDLLTAIDGVTFDQAWAHRVPGHFGTSTVDYISLGDLIRNKQTSARPQDLLDVEDLATGR